MSTNHGEPRTVLMVVPAWPPVNTVGSRRPLRIARRLPSSGWRPIVLTPEPPGCFYLTPPGLDPSQPAPEVEVRRVRARFTGVRARRALGAILGAMGLLRVERLIQIGINRLLLPDHLPEWTFAAVREARQVASHTGVDAVWVTAPPFGAFIVAAIIARYLDAPLVLDYRDPWTRAPRLRPRRYPFGIPRWLMEALERWVVRNAEGVSYVYPDNLEWNRAQFGRPPSHVWRVIPNGFDPIDLPEGPAARFERPTVVYAGSCYGGRSLLPVLRSIRAGCQAGIEMPRLLFHGELDPSSREFIEQNQAALEAHVSVQPRIPLGELAPKLRGATALLLITGEEHKHAVAAKIFDYFLAERPVLAYGPRGSVMEGIIGRTGTGTWVSVEAGERALRDALHHIVQEPAAYQPVVEEVQRWSADTMAERTARLLDDVARTRDLAGRKSRTSDG